MNLKEIIAKAKLKTGEADTAVRYFDGKHDILKNRIIYVNDEGNVIEDTYSSNIRIPHPFFTELIQQSTNNIFYAPVAFRTDNELLQELLDTYITSKTHEVLNEVVEEASKKGWEWVYVYKDADGLPAFQVVDGRQIAEVKNDDGDTIAVVRFYDKVVQVWDRYTVKKYVEGERGEYILVSETEHSIYDDGKATLGFGIIPWYKLKNNRQEKSDLHLIKPFIDDYDIMASYASNELQDFKGNIYVLKGAKGQDLSRLKMNIKNMGAISTGQLQDLDVKQQIISIDSRLQKMDIDKRNIYGVGQGFDETTITNTTGNVTNEALRAGQRKLIQKCNGKIKYINGLLDWMLDIILTDIERRGLGVFGRRDIIITYTHDIIQDERTNAETAKIKEEVIRAKLDIIIKSGMVLDELTVLEMACDLLGVDMETVRGRLGVQDYADLIGGE